MSSLSGMDIGQGNHSNIQMLYGGGCDDRGLDHLLRSNLVSPL